MIITISGMPGSGKTTVGKIVAKKLGFKFYSIGELRGKMATERGITIEELNEIGEEEDWTDKEADEYQKDLAENEDDFVIEGRLGFHFIPKSFKIFLKVDAKEAAKRIFKDPRHDEKKKETLRDVLMSMKKRMESDRMRYRKYYGIDDFMDESNYDLVIDTTVLSVEQVSERIMGEIEKHN